MRLRQTSIAWLLLALCFLGQPALAGESEVWWASAKAESEREGYRLIDDRGVRKLLDSAGDTLLIDARADYEFMAGHIPGSVNMEFDLGDRMELPGAKRAALKKLIGPDKKRMLVIYCRSFR